MLNLNIPKIDTALAEEGAWVEFQPGISFLIRRERTPQYVSAIQAIHKRHKRQLDAGTASNEVIDAAMAEAQARHILVGWSGLTEGDDHKPLPYSVDAALAIMRDPAYQELRDWVMDQSRDVENYRGQQLKEQ